MSLDKVRIDKWLWSVRIFKSRTLSTEACKAGKIKIDDIPIKPAYPLQRGEIVQVRKNNFNYTYKVIDLIQKRVSATLAQPCYEDLTPKEELDKFKNWYSAKEYRERGTGRPTKRERRTIDKFKNNP